MPTGQKSPLHPSALTINGLTRDRRIIRFNIEGGISGEYFIVNPPRVRNTNIGRQLVVDVRDVQSGHQHEFFLTDMGVVQDSSHWNPVNFTVDHSKRYLLPEPLGCIPWVGRLGLSDEIFDDDLA